MIGCWMWTLIRILSITEQFRPPMPSTKRPKLEKNSDTGSDDDDGVINRTSDASEGDLEEDGLDDHQASPADESPDTEDEIAAAKTSKSKKTLKRKRRATDPSSFGATLNALLSTDAPSSLPLSLRPSAARKRNEEKQEFKAKRAQRIEKKERDDRGRITDVIGGWGGESEMALRKVAQRGGEYRYLRFQFVGIYGNELFQW
jgi:hypothetical protein